MNGPRQSPPVLAFETIDSTNAEAHRRAAAGERGPIWITAGRQEAGRGRSGRAWSSPPGNFSASFLFMPEGAVPSAYHQVSFISGVGDPLVEFQDLSVSYGPVQALASVSGAFHAGSASVAMAPEPRTN